MSVEKPRQNLPPNPNPHLHSRARGRPFEKGNGGRRPGSRNRATVVAEALLKDEEVELVRKAKELAKAGDVPMLKFLLDRILPKERSVRVDLPPIVFANDAVDALGAIIAAVATGQIAPGEASALASLVAAYARTINVADLELRMDNSDCLGNSDHSEAARVECIDLASGGRLRNGSREGFARCGAAAWIGVVADARDPGPACLGVRRGDPDSQTDDRHWPQQKRNCCLHIPPPLPEVSLLTASVVGLD